MRIKSGYRLASIAALLASVATTLGAQTSGVLIGIRRSGVNEKSVASRYETLWIVNSRQSPLRDTLPDLLVPRADGFWRAGVTSTCGSGDEEASIDQLWTVPAAQQPSLGSGCEPVAATDIPGYAIQLDSAQLAAIDTLQVMCNVVGMEIHFITGEFVGTFTSSRQTEQCEPRGSRYDYSPSMRRFASDTVVELKAVAASGADSAFARAARRSVQLGPDEDCGFRIADAESRASAADEVDGWYVSRWKGRWRASVFHHVYGSECSFDAPMQLGLLPRFTGHDTLRPGWSVIARGVPKAVDAVSSPKGDLVVAFTADSLYAFESNGTTLGARLLAMPFPRERVVMIQWAVGRNVARWSAELERLAPLLRPAVVRDDGR